MKSLPTLVLAFAVFAVPASAHEDHGHHDHHDQPSAPSQAGEDHAKPHGGQVFVLDAADHLHAEVVFSETGLHLWLYDADMKPLAPPSEAKVTLVVGKEVRKLELKVMQKFGDAIDAHLGIETAIPKDAKAAAVFQVKLNGKVRSGRLERIDAVHAGAAVP